MLARLAAAATPGDGPVAERLCAAYVEMVGADGGAITMAPATIDRLTLTASRGVATRLEQLQDVLGEGPTQAAYRHGEVVVARLDSSDGDAFPVFSKLAAGVVEPMTIWAIPMRPAGAEPVGVITVYRHTGELSQSLDAAAFLADFLAVSLLHGPDPAQMDDAPGWPDRARVHQATGMLIARFSVGPEDAMALLRARAFAEGKTLAATTTEILNGG